jgi:phospholipid/cholesterol/gamma-HCH transport system permease protein
MANLYSQVSMVDLYVGMGKCLVFGTAVGLIAGYLGLQTTGGAAGVGKAANNTVTYTIVLILVADYLASMLLLSLGL